MLAVAVVTTALSLASGPAAFADTTVGARLKPLNGSGFSGTVSLTSHSDGSLTVAIHARGLVPNQPHAQHIHGSAEGGHFMCPTKADDTNGDGILTNEEATGEYGTIYLSLTTHGSASPRSGLSLDRMPVADGQGRLDYSRTFPASAVPNALRDRLSHVHVVIHGIDANHNCRYDVKGLGVSTFARNLGMKGVPEEATDPAACGMVTGAGMSVKPKGGVETGRGALPAGHGTSHTPTRLAVALLAASLALLVPGLTRLTRPRQRPGAG
jgi:hypothetical protein